jgi:TPR repeat protein
MISPLARAFVVFCAGCLFLDAVSSAYAQQSEADRKLFESVKAKAEKGDPKEQYNLAIIYFVGKLGVPRDAVEAAKWHRKAADQGHATAQHTLGVMYANGQGVPKDAGEAVKWYRKAADQEDAGAQCGLGIMYANGEGVPKDASEAVKWYRKAADQGDAGGQCSLGFMYARGEGVPKDAVEAAKWYRKAADQGDTGGQCNLGVMYARGEGVPKDAVEAAKWYRKAADQGEVGAQCNLGAVYANGKGVPKDMAEAAKWYRKAADQGFATAQGYLGDMYANGKGVPKDAVEAVKWFRKAADQGDAEAQCQLGFMYSNGGGAPKDMVEAAKWSRKAADQGNARAQCNLGIMYANGEGVPKDAGEAAKWHRKAANQGDAGAQGDLGVMYANGNGVPKDDVEAYKWFNLAAAGGDENAAKNRSKLEMNMSREEIIEAQRRSRTFVPREEDQPGSSSGDRLSAFPERSQPAPMSSGTGFFISEDGYLVTNEHVVKDSSQVRLVTADGLISAKVVKVDAANDLAILKAEGKFFALPVASSRSVKLGATAATVGFPNIGLQGFAPKLAKGEIGSLAGIQDDPRHFQISAPVQPGNSGGALVDERVNVIGVVVGKLSQRAALVTSGALAENVNYAVKSSFLLSFLESLPDVAAKLKEPATRERKFEDVVKDAERATVLVLVY